MSNLRAHVSGEKALLSKVPPRGAYRYATRPKTPESSESGSGPRDPRTGPHEASPL